MKVKVERLNGRYYVVSSNWGDILFTQNIHEAEREYHYQKHTLANIDTEDAESIKIEFQDYEDGRLIKQGDYICD